MIVLILLFGIAIGACGQIFYGDITKEEYKEYVDGQAFYPAKILYIDNSIEEGYVSRINDSELIRFKKNIDDDVRIISPRHIKSFMYGVKDWGYPQYVYKNLESKANRRLKIRPVEIVSKGEINVYTYKWVELPDTPWLPYSQAYHTMNVLFYLEKNNKMYPMYIWSRNIKELIKDKETVFKEYKENYLNLYKKTDEYAHFIKLINLYNETK